MPIRDWLTSSERLVDGGCQAFTASKYGDVLHASQGQELSLQASKI